MAPPLNDPGTWDRRDALALGGLALLAILLRLPHWVAPYVINLDAIHYVDAAKAASQGRVLDGLLASHASVFPLLIAVVQPLVGDWVTAGRLFPSIFGVLTVAPYYLLSRQIVGRSHGWIPVLLYVLSPTVVTVSVDVVREPLAWFFLAWALWSLVKGLAAGGMGLVFLSGLLGLVLVSVRMDGLVFVGAAALFALYKGIRSHALLRGLMHVLWIAMPTALAVGAVLMAAPDAARDGDLLEWGAYQRQARSAVSSPAAMEEEIERLMTLTPQRRVRNLLAVAWEDRRVLAAWEFLRHLVAAAHPLSFLLVLAGVLHPALWRRGQWHLPAALAAVWIMATYARVAGTFAIGKRHLIPLVMMGYLFGAWGFAWICRAAAHRWPRFTARQASVVLALLLLVATAPKAVQPGRGDKLARRQAGEWIATLNIPSPRLVTDHGHVAFYAGGRAVSVAAFLAHPHGDADLLVLEEEAGKRPAAHETLPALEGRGWRPEPLRSFRAGRAAVTVYALGR